MRKEDFFEVLGELDDELVQSAGAPVKKRPNWRAWGLAAACLALACAVALCVFPLKREDEPERQCVADVAPMVYVNDTLYKQSGDQQGYPELKDEFVYLGKIESTTAQEGAPTENFQANDLIVGCEVYQYGENIVVHINGAYWLYMRYGENEVNWDDLLTEQERKELDPTYMG